MKLALFERMKLALLLACVAAGGQSIFDPNSILVLRGGSGLGFSTNNIVYAMSVAEYASNGTLLRAIAVPSTSTGGNVRCGLQFSSAGGYAPDGYPQLSFDRTMVVWPCNDVNLGTTLPTSVSTRVIGRLWANGSVSTSIKSTTLFTASTTASLIRTVATLDGSAFYATGSTSSITTNGLHILPAGSTTSSRILNVNSTFQQFVTVGPAWPGSGRLASSPQLYLSFRGPRGSRGVHSVGWGLPSSVILGNTAMLPGFGAHQSATDNATLPLIGSFVFEPDGRTLWTADTQGHQSGLTPAPAEKTNLVQWVWDEATARYMRGAAMGVDAATQVQMVTGRYEDGAGNVVPAPSGDGGVLWTIYSCTNSRLFRIVPLAVPPVVQVIANATSGIWFVGPVLPPSPVPFNWTAVPEPSPSPSVTPSPTPTASPSAEPSPTPSASVSSTLSLTSSPSAAAAVPSSTGTGSPSRVPAASNASATSASGSSSPAATPSPSGMRGSGNTTGVSPTPAGSGPSNATSPTGGTSASASSTATAAAAASSASSTPTSGGAGTPSVSRTSDPSGSSSRSGSRSPTPSLPGGAAPSVTPSYAPIAHAGLSFTLTLRGTGITLVALTNASHAAATDALVAALVKDVVCAAATAAAAATASGSSYDPSAFSSSSGAPVAAWVGGMRDGATGLGLALDRGERVNTRAGFSGNPCPQTQRLLRAPEHSTGAWHRGLQGANGSSSSVDLTIGVSLSPPRNLPADVAAGGSAEVFKWERSQMVLALDAVRAALSALDDSAAPSTSDVRAALRRTFAATLVNLGPPLLPAAASSGSPPELSLRTIPAGRDPLFVPVEATRDGVAAPSPPAPGAGDGSGSTTIGIAAGVGGGGGLLVLALLAVWAVRRRARSSSPSHEKTSSSSSSSSSSELHVQPNSMVLAKANMRDLLVDKAPGDGADSFQQSNPLARIR